MVAQFESYACANSAVDRAAEVEGHNHK